MTLCTKIVANPMTAAKKAVKLSLDGGERGGGKPFPFPFRFTRKFHLR
jgi:hypothetical protein